MNDIISRSDARSKGLSQYFTGIPCKNNHLSYRYTQSGACSGCIRSYNLPIEEFNQQRLEGRKIRSERQLKIDSLLQIKERIFDVDLSFFRSIVYAAAIARDSSIQMREIWEPGSGSKRNDETGMHKFNCFAEDLESLRQTARALFASHMCKPIIKVYVPPPEYWPEHDPK